MQVFLVGKRTFTCWDYSPKYIYIHEHSQFWNLPAKKKKKILLEKVNQKFEFFPSLVSESVRAGEQQGQLPPSSDRCNQFTFCPLLLLQPQGAQQQRKLAMEISHGLWSQLQPNAKIARTMSCTMKRLTMRDESANAEPGEEVCLESKLYFALKCKSYYILSTVLI